MESSYLVVYSAGSGLYFTEWDTLRAAKLEYDATINSGLYDNVWVTKVIAEYHG